MQNLSPSLEFLEFLRQFLGDNIPLKTLLKCINWVKVPKNFQFYPIKGDISGKEIHRHTPANVYFSINLYKKVFKISIFH